MIISQEILDCATPYKRFRSAVLTYLPLCSPL